MIKYLIILNLLLLLALNVNCNTKDYYKILGITKKSNAKDIKKAYIKQAKIWHPDKNPNNKIESDLKFKEISEAYETLSNKDKKHIYDSYGKDSDNRGNNQFYQYHQQQQHRSNRRQSFHFGGGDFHEQFHQQFHEQFHQQFHQQQQQYHHFYQHHSSSNWISNIMNNLITVMSVLIPLFLFGIFYRCLEFIDDGNGNDKNKKNKKNMNNGYDTINNDKLNNNNYNNIINNDIKKLTLLDLHSRDKINIISVNNISTSKIKLIKNYFINDPINFSYISCHDYVENATCNIDDSREHTMSLDDNDSDNDINKDYVNIKKEDYISDNINNSLINENYSMKDNNDNLKFIHLIASKKGGNISI